MDLCWSPNFVPIRMIYFLIIIFDLFKTRMATISTLIFDEFIDLSMNFMWVFAIWCCASLKRIKWMKLDVYYNAIRLSFEQNFYKRKHGTCSRCLGIRIMSPKQCKLASLHTSRFTIAGTSFWKEINSRVTRWCRPQFNSIFCQHQNNDSM